MQISFFEEFPNKKNLEKLDLIKFPVKIYLAEYSIVGYKQYKKELQGKYKNLKEVIWWPILNVNEGYWLSPWTKRRALLRLFHYLLNESISILWDAELPKERKLIFTQFFKHFKNKKLIKAFFNKYKGEIYTAEYLAESKFLDFNCLNFNPNNYNNVKKVKMFYTSMHSWLTADRIKDQIKTLQNKYGDKIIIGLGVLSLGINKSENLISPVQLERDLIICKDLNVKEVIIYQLNGLNKDYIKVINKFT